MICCLVWASVSRLIFHLGLVKSWVQPAVQYFREQFVQRWQGAYRAVITHIFRVSFLVYHFNSHSSTCHKIKFILLYDFVEDLSHLSFVPSSHAFMSSALIPLLSAALPFLSLLTAFCNSSVVWFGNFNQLFSIIFSLIPVRFHLFHHVDLHHTACFEILQRHWQFLIVTWWLLLESLPVFSFFFCPWCIF